MSERSSARSYEFHPHAATDLAEEAQYLRDDDREVAQRFEGAVGHASPAFSSTPRSEV